MEIALKYKKMKKIFVKVFVFSIILFSSFTLPWVEDAFLLVETENPKKIQQAIETDYSLKDFTRYKEKENLLMAALKYARANEVIDLLLHEANISPDTKTKDGVTALMYACQYETDIDAVKNVLITDARKDSKKAKRILTTDKNGENCFDYARKNETISTEVLELLSMYAQEPVKETQEAEEVPEEELEEELPLQEPVEEVENLTIAEAEEEEAEVLEIAEATEDSVEETAPLPEKNTLLDLGSITSPSVLPESIYLYDYADDKYKSLAIPSALIAAEEAAKHFISEANKRDDEGRTKLMMAAKDGDIALIEDLLYSGAQINAKDNEGWTALMYAARFQSNSDVTKLLLYKGAERSSKNKYGLTALMLASAYSESAGVVSVLLESYNASSDEARAAFSYGISNYNKPDVLQAFLDKRVPLNIPYEGKTPLMTACQTNKNTQIIEWLLKNGASKYQVEAATGKTAFDYAKENKKLPHNVAYWSLNPNS